MPNDQLVRENKLKNVVMIIIDKVRVEKKKPKLRDILQKLNENGEQNVSKEVVLHKLYQLYSK